MKKHWWIALILVLALAVPAMASQVVKILVDGKELKTDVPAQIIDGRAMVPLRAIAEFSGKVVNWDAKTQTVTIAGKSDLEKIDRIFGDYTYSGHKILTASVDRTGVCLSCHDNSGFALRTGDRAQSTTYVFPGAGRKTGLSCESCHAAFGKKLIDTGKVQLPFTPDGELTNGGTGALCMSCHNGRRDVNDVVAKQVNDQGFRTASTYPHYGGAQVYTGKGAMEVPGVKFATSFGHQGLKDSCVSCHMPKIKDGFKSHDFKMDVGYINESCGSCHAGISSFDVNGFQTKIYAMNKKLKQAAINAVPGAVDIVSGSGRLQFRDAGGREIPIAQVSQKAFLAGYNWYTIYGDKSKGVHNPKYAESVIRESYKYVTGKDM
ncbi:MAG: ammonia-forming cytochrome c nitrite reductase subunit c552 [Clostridia bacterium]|nr:ammonia-forming cytochrome c nitrite reductase subunit c552 [Clostridia bacterium]